MMTEKRMIDANALVDKVRLDWGLTHQSQLISAATKLAAADAMCKLLGEVAKCQTIDAVPVVRCRECKESDYYSADNWKRNHAATPKHLLQLKKPILPERWRGPREGWSQWSELLINPGITIKGMPDLQSEPLTAKMIYGAIQKLGENWRLK